MFWETKWVWSLHKFTVLGFHMSSSMNRTIVDKMQQHKLELRDLWVCLDTSQLHGNADRPGYYQAWMCAPDFMLPPRGTSHRAPKMSAEDARDMKATELNDFTSCDLWKLQGFPKDKVPAAVPESSFHVPMARAFLQSNDTRKKSDRQPGNGTVAFRRSLLDGADGGGFRHFGTYCVFWKCLEILNGVAHPSHCVCYWVCPVGSPGYDKAAARNVWWWSIQHLMTAHLNELAWSLVCHASPWAMCRWTMATHWRPLQTCSCRTMYMILAQANL